MHSSRRKNVDSTHIFSSPSTTLRAPPGSRPPHSCDTNARFSQILGQNTAPSLTHHECPQILNQLKTLGMFSVTRHTIHAHTHTRTAFHTRVHTHEHVHNNPRKPTCVYRKRERLRWGLTHVSRTFQTGFFDVYIFLQGVYLTGLSWAFGAFLGVV